ncbi:MAG TPA: hypothetical protein VND64_19650 [Pirellulales bacterium]|nr:hypothetical protein [Pirellulales bacterium]
MPNGFRMPQEARLGDTQAFISANRRDALMHWWLANPKNANVPNWDVASGASIDGREGLILVEAKAHTNEFPTEGKSTGGNAQNHNHIEQAIKEANDGLNEVMPGWNLTAKANYQICNRFAWAWKLAALGVPVTLVYLGFLNAQEMADQGPPFCTSDAWTQAVRAHSQGFIPEAAWHETFLFNGTPLRALLRSMTLEIGAA